MLTARGLGLGSEAGSELAAVLRKRGCEAKVLFTSGYHSDAQIDDLAFVPKPYVPHQLATKVREILDH